MVKHELEHILQTSLTKSNNVGCQGRGIVDINSFEFLWGKHVLFLKITVSEI